MDTLLCTIKRSQFQLNSSLHIRTYHLLFCFYFCTTTSQHISMNLTDIATGLLHVSPAETHSIQHLCLSVSSCIFIYNFFQSMHTYFNLVYSHYQKYSSITVDYMTGLLIALPFFPLHLYWSLCSMQWYTVPFGSRKYEEHEWEDLYQQFEWGGGGGGGGINHNRSLKCSYNICWVRNVNYFWI